ncbi:putative ribonuclease H-like domain-containing protein [Tanacetum coccineum]
MVPRAVLMKSGLVSVNTARQNIFKTAVSVNTARQVNAAHSKTTVNAARPMSYLSKIAHSTVKKTINKNTSFKNSNINQRVNTVRGKEVNTARPKAVVNAVKGNNVNVVKASACWVWKPKTKVLDHGNPQMDLQDQGVIDSGCSRHMTGNMSYLTDYEEIDGGYVAFGGNPKGGKITGKGTIKTGNLDFENVYFVRELKFNLFSVSQMCDKKNSVLFNDTECIVLSPNFKLIDESQVLLRVPRKNNMYSVDLKNIVPKGGLTCLFAKATSDESKLWHRRLGHLNFKTMNKLVKGNLVRGLPSKLFENDQTCVACQKGKQYRASLDHKVKVIRCDNGIEFKNKEMNQFCEMKGILRQFSVARTPQQNGVAERRNRTLIEAARTMLADSKTPTLCFMRPFGCPVTILNTIDHLGKFDGKADEGFFVGYSLNSKAFRVFNSRTRIVEENLHIRFSESTPNVVGTQSNGFAGTKASDNAGQAIKEIEPVKDYILLPLWTFDSSFSQNSKSSDDDGSKPLSDDGKKVDEDLRKDSECNDQEKEDNVNSTNNVNAASTNEFNAVGEKTSIELPVDPNMPALEDYNIFASSKDDKDVGAEADINNLDTTIQVSPIPTTRIHKDHPLDQEEPKKVIHALKDPSWIEAMQEELLQFKLQEVWTFVDLLIGKRTIGSKWVFKNKKDERGIVIRNKSRLVAQGYTQEEGIDYDEVFAHIEEEVYVCQPPGFEDLEFPNRVYKVEKALYGLHQAPRAWYETLSTYMLNNKFQRGKIDKTLFIKRHKGDILLVQVYVDDIIFGSTKKELCNAFEKLMHEKFQMCSMGELTFFLGLQVQQKKDGIFISQDKYVDEILKKFRFTEVKTSSTPIETQKPLLKDEDGKEVDVHMYRSMIGSLMYLTSSRPDIMFAVCQPKLGLWYPKDSPFDLVEYTDSDYAGASLDRKSTTGCCQFLGCKLISWQCKKQTVVANSTTEAEYVAASRKANKSVRLMMEELCKNKQSDLVRKRIERVGYYQGKNSQWGSKVISPSGWEEEIIIESTVRRDLQLKDAEGVDCMVKNLDNVGNFLMYPRVRKGFSGRETPLFPTMVVHNQEEMGEGSAIPTDPHHTPTFIQPSPQPQKTQKTRRPKKNDTQVHQSSVPSDNVADKAVYKELDDSLTTKTTQANEIASLKRRVKKLEKKDRSRTHKLKRLYKVSLSARVESSRDEEDLGEDASKQGRRIHDIDADEDITLVNDDNKIFNVDALAGEEVYVAEQSGNVVEEVVAMIDAASTIPVSAATITDVEITLAQALAELKSAKPKADKVVIQEPEQGTTTTTPTTIIPVPKPPQDKGKGIMTEEPVVEQVKPMKRLEQMRLDEELAFKLQAEAEEERISR